MLEFILITIFLYVIIIILGIKNIKNESRRKKLIKLLDYNKDLICVSDKENYPFYFIIKKNKNSKEIIFYFDDKKYHQNIIMFEERYQISERNKLVERILYLLNEYNLYF